MVIKSMSIKLLKTSYSVAAFKAGDTIFHEGDVGDQMYVIKSGSVELRTENLVIGTFVTGDIIGEMALVDQEDRSATALALTDCELVSVDYARFRAMILEEPDFAIEVMQTMSARLRHMNRETTVIRKQAETTRIQAMVDPLTGAYNRRVWDERMAIEESRCRRLGRTASMVSVDLDGLKALNDSAGHAKGDALIKGAATALFEACRGTDIVARLGGDEFGVLALDCPHDAGVQLVHRIHTAMKKRHIKASVGLATRQPGRDLKQTWDDADQAMYAEKRKHHADPAHP